MSDKNFKVKNGLDANGAVTITQPNTSTTPLTISANTLATGSDLFQIKRPDGTVRFAVGNDGALTVTSSGITGGAYGTFLDIEGTAKTEAELITKYRQMEMHPEVARALEDIVDESIVVSKDGKVIEINLDNTELSDNIKKRITEEFEEALRLLDFSNKGYDVFQRFYVDGRLKYHAVIDESNLKAGIQELRYVDPRKLRKIREVEKKKDNAIDATLITTKNE